MYKLLIFIHCVSLTVPVMQKSVKRLEKCDFIMQLFSLIDKPLCDNDRKSLNVAYNRFINRIQQISKQDGCSRLDSLQLLARIRETLVQLLENYNDSTAWFTVNVSSTPTVVIPGDDDVIVLPGPETVKWYQKDISLYILLIVILVVGFLLYIVYTVWKRRGDGQ